MSLYEIYVPTFGRAKTMTTQLAFPNVVIVCPESQLEEYKRFNPDLEYMPCPDKVEKNMARKRNWIKDNARKDWFLMMDDDLKYLQYIQGGVQFKFDANGSHEMFVNNFVMCEELKTVLWGINLQTDPKFYREYSPFSFLSVILGPFSGHIKNSLRYDERFPTKEDYDYSLQVLHKYHRILRCNKYAYLVGHIDGGSGGSHSIRRLQLEEDQNIALQKKWGSRIIKFDMSKDIDPKVSIPLKGI